MNLVFWGGAGVVLLFNFVPHVSEVMQYLSSPVWLTALSGTPARSTHVLANSVISFCLMAEKKTLVTKLSGWRRETRELYSDKNQICHFLIKINTCSPRFRWLCWKGFLYFFPTCGCWFVLFSFRPWWAGCESNSVCHLPSMIIHTISLSFSSSHGNRSIKNGLYINAGRISYSTSDKLDRMVCWLAAFPPSLCQSRGTVPRAGVSKLWGFSTPRSSRHCAKLQSPYHPTLR